MSRRDTHSLLVGYILWIFGFFGFHRFYYGRPVSGTIYLFTLGLLGVGWIVDLFMMPALHESADRRYVPGHLDYNVGWLLLSYLGVFGAHRYYMGKWVSGLLYLLTGGVFLLGWIFDFWTLNDQISDENEFSVRSIPARSH